MTADAQQIRVTVVRYPPGTELVRYMREHVGRDVPVWVSCRESYAFWCEHQDAHALDIRDAGRVTEIVTPCVLIDPDQSTVDEVIRKADGDIEVFVLDGRKAPVVPSYVMTRHRRLGYKAKPPEHSPAG